MQITKEFKACQVKYDNTDYVRFDDGKWFRDYGGYLEPENDGMEVELEEKFNDAMILFKYPSPSCFFDESGVIVYVVEGKIYRGSTMTAEEKEFIKNYTKK